MKRLQRFFGQWWWIYQSQEYIGGPIFWPKHVWMVTRVWKMMGYGKHYHLKGER